MTEVKQRHGCLTAWLIFMMIGNSLSAVIYFVANQAIKEAFPTVPDWKFLLLGVLSIFNLVCAIALFKWQKWGFWGFIASSIVTLILNLSIGIGIGQSLSGLVGIILLFVVLNIGENNKGWSQLK